MPADVCYFTEKPYSSSYVFNSWCHRVLATVSHILLGFDSAVCRPPRHLVNLPANYFRQALLVNRWPPHFAAIHDHERLDVLVEHESPFETTTDVFRRQLLRNKRTVRCIVRLEIVMSVCDWVQRQYEIQQVESRKLELE